MEASVNRAAMLWVVLGVSLGTAGASLAQGVTAPPIKAGWWEIAMSIGGRSTVIQRCTDPSTEKANAAFSAGITRQDCSENTVRKTASGWAFESTCKVGKMTTTSEGVATGDFQSGYRVAITTHMSPAPTPALAETHMTMDAKWTGPCPAGRKPGDMMMPGGMVVNVGKATVR